MISSNSLGGNVTRLNFVPFDIKYINAFVFSFSNAVLPKANGFQSFLMPKLEVARGVRCCSQRTALPRKYDTKNLMSVLQNKPISQSVDGDEFLSVAKLYETYYIYITLILYIY